MQMSAFRIFQTTVCLSVLFVAVADPQEMPPSGIFEWCKKAECTGTRGYERFYKIEDFENVNKSAARWDIYLGVWSASTRMYILMSEVPRLDWAVSYLLELGVWYPSISGGMMHSLLNIMNGAVKQIWLDPLDKDKMWRLPWKEPRFFVIRITRGTGRNLILEQIGNDKSGNTVLIEYSDNHPALNISYISFYAQPVSNSEKDRMRTKIFFDCPHPRYGDVRFLAKNVVPRLSQVELPSCRPDLCEQCPRVYLPVCSTEHRTYRNECLFRCQQPNSTVKVLHKGLCMHWLWQI